MNTALAHPASEEQPSNSSLRSRKRAATSSTICRAAIELGLAHGYENVTVEMICAASDVSPRTFFNYFGSKEGAYISPRKLLPDEQEHRHFVEGHNPSVFGGLFDLISGTVLAAETDMDLFQRRHQLIHQTPELLNREKTRLGETEDVFVGYVLERFAHDGRTKAQTPDLEDEARMVVALVSGALRFALQKWAGGNFSSNRFEIIHTTSALVQRVTANEHWP